MTDQDDPFADLEETVSGETADDAGEDQPPTTPPSTSDADSSGPSSEAADPDADQIEEQAFEFEETRQSAFYVREATWDEFDTLLTEIELEAKKRGAKNVSKSEIHDAILRNIDAEEIAEAVVDERRR